MSRTLANQSTLIEQSPIIQLEQLEGLRAMPRYIHFNKCELYADNTLTDRYIRVIDCSIRVFLSG